MFPVAEPVPILAKYAPAKAIAAAPCEKSSMSHKTDDVLIRLRAALQAAYGRRLKRAVLFGSRARGTAGPQADYDVAVFLEGSIRLGEEAERLAEIGTDLLFDTGAVINALPLRAGAEAERTGFMQEIRRDGREF